MSIETTISGPIYNGDAVDAAQDFLDEATYDLANLAANEIQARLGQVLEHPTGHYKSQVVTDRATTGWDVTDQGVIYGPWLEGTGSRNKTSRFKGYSTFRRIKQSLSGRAATIAEGQLDRHLDRMGGG